MKAWIVSEVGEWRMAWFAETRGKARVEAAAAYGVDEPFASGFSVRRAPLLDPYLDYWRGHENVPPEAWWEAGYTAPCGACGEPVGKDGSCGEDDCSVEHGAPVCDGVEVYHAACAPKAVSA